MKRPMRLRHWKPVVAASLCLAVLGVIVLSLVDRDGLLAGQVVEDASLRLALDTAESEQVLQVRGATVAVLGSFRARGEDLCRAFIRERDGVETLAIACIDTAGDWTVAFSAEGSAAVDTPGHQAASDERTAEAEAFLRDALQARPIDPDEERRLIERGWTR